jgi:MFS family permease
MFLAGNTLFTAASLLAGAATEPGMLIAARFGQGVGSAIASAVVLGILVTLFTEAEERAKAIGIFSFTGAAGASIGQVLGGVLTDALGWNWIFFINLPIGVATIALAIRALPDERGAGGAAGADIIGAVLVTSGLMSSMARSTPAWRCFPRRWPSAACPCSSPLGSTPASASEPSCWRAWRFCSGRWAG